VLVGAKLLVAPALVSSLVAGFGDESINEFLDELLDLEEGSAATVMASAERA